MTALVGVKASMSPRLGEVVLASQSDERLVKLASAGHERAFAVIVERYSPELSAFARRLSQDGKAEDIVQQAFLSAFAALRSGADVKHLRGWLYRIVRNAAARSQAPLCMPLDGAAASGESVEDVVQQRDLAMNALAEVARLPKRQRQAIVGTALDGRGRAEVATSMGVSEGAVRQLVHRARARIRTAVTAVTPLPLVRWLAQGPSGGASSVSVTAGAGGASSVGVALKLGIVLASGAIVTGVAAVDIHRGERRPDRAPARIVASRAARRDNQVAVVGPLARAPVYVDAPEGSHAAAAVAASAHRAGVRRPRDGAAVRQDWHRRRGDAGSDRGSDRGGGNGSGWSDGGAGGSSRGDPVGSRDGAGPRGGGADQGRDGPSGSGPLAVSASEGGSQHAGAWGSHSGSGNDGSGPGHGSGASWGSDSGYGSGSGSGWVSGASDGGSPQGSGAGWGSGSSAVSGAGTSTASGAGTSSAPSSGEVGSGR
jgi:RNA polymerase sigma factor (sigma-70 family)